MRVSGPSPSVSWLPLRLTQQVVVQAASHASQPTAKPVTAPDRVETSSASPSARRSVLDIRV